MMDKLNALVARLIPAWRRRQRFRRWQDRWNRPDQDSPWMNRSVSKEIEAVVHNGWFCPGSLALDLGCGEGDVTQWLAQQGFHAVGVDIAPAAIARAKARHPEMPDKLEFQAQDLCAEPLLLRNVSCFIDRGCFHTLPPCDVDAYVRNIVAVAARHARLLLFTRAFRENTGRSRNDEQAEILSNVERAFAAAFRVIRIAETNLGGIAPDGSQRQLPGLVFWLTRLDAATEYDLRRELKRGDSPVSNCRPPL